MREQRYSRAFVDLVFHRDRAENLQDAVQHGGESSPARRRQVHQAHPAMRRDFAPVTRKGVPIVRSVPNRRDVDLRVTEKAGAIDVHIELAALTGMQG